MKLILGILPLILILSNSGVFAMIDTLPLEELVRQSELIVVAKLKMVNKLPKDKDGWVRVDNIVIIEEILKGTGETGEEKIVETLEGFEDSPKLSGDGKFILFLTPLANSTKFIPTNMIQGYWPLDKNGKPLGMGLGITRKQLEEAIKKVKDTKSHSAQPTQPSF